MKYLIILAILIASCGREVRTENRYVPGPTGPAGANGYNTIMEIAPTTTCDAGGVTLLFALDTNRNNIIDSTDENIKSGTVCNGVDGLPGENAVLNDATPVAVLNPCGDASGIEDEVLLKLADGTVLTSFSDNNNGKNTRFSILYNGTYTTTDGDYCTFVLTDGNIAYESHTNE